MQTVFNRRNSEDVHDAYEEYYRHFGKAPGFIFKGGGFSEDEVAYADRDDVKKKDVMKALANLKAVTDDVCSKMKESFKSETDLKYDKLIWINATAGTVYSLMIFHEQKLIIQCVQVLSKKARNIFLFAEQDSPEVQHFASFIASLTPRKKAKKDTIKIISMDDGNFYMTSIDLEKKQHTFSMENYNEDFDIVSKRIINDLSKEDDNGLVLLHGGIGTGKTSYLKHLLRSVGVHKQIVYVPPDLAQSLSSPSFVTFLIKEATNSILLIEDAENILKHREAGGNQAVSNILNISDGILGDVLKIQIVCTFNCTLDQIDPALRRPGRLISEYEFKKLTSEKSNVLMKKVHGESVIFEVKPMTLAEIYNYNNMPTKSNPEREKFLGFSPT